MDKKRNGLWALAMTAILSLILCLGAAVACGGDDDDDDDDDTGVDDDTDDDTDDDVDDDTDDDVDDDTDDDADDDADDDIDPNAIGGYATDFKEGTPLPGATVEAVDNTTGLSFDPAITAVADAEGYVLLEGVPAAKGAVAIKLSLNGYRDTYQFGFETGNGDETFLGVSNSVVTLVSGLLGIVPDDTKGFASGAVYYVNSSDEEEAVGCAEVTFDPAVAEVHYFKESGLGVLPTSERDTDGNGIGDENGKGTNGQPTSDDGLMSYFVGVNADPGSYDVTADADGSQAMDTIPYLCANCVAITTVLFQSEDFAENPTPDFCTN